jgi:WD40 repeat protein
LDRKVTALAISSAPTRYIACADFLCIRIWDLVNQRFVKTIHTDHISSIVTLNFTPNNQKIISTSVDHSIRIWGTELAQLELA